MGNDITWHAIEPDMAKQKQAALFLNIMLKKLNWTVSDKDCRDTDVHKGFQYEYFINLDAINERMIDDRKKLCFALTGNHDFYNKYGEHAIPKPTPRKFTGFTAHLEGRNNYKDDYYEYWVPHFLAQWQLTIVFNNSPLPGSIEKQGELVTFECIKKPRHIMTKALYDLLKAENKAEYVKLFVYRKGGNTRVSGQKDLFVILYLIRELFIPSLHVSDDYRYIHDMDQEIDKAGFKKNLSIPSQKWRAVNDILKEYTDIEIHSEDATPQMFKRWGRFL